MARQSAGDPAPPDAVEPTGRKRSSLMHSLAYFVPSYLLAIIGYLALSVIAGRMLGLSAFGYYVVLVTAATFVGQLSLLGVHRAGLREVARTDDAETLKRLRRGVRAVLLIPLPITSILAAAAVWASRIGDGGYVATAVLTGILVYQSGYGIVTTSLLRGLGHVKAAGLVAGRSGGALVAVAQVACLLLIAWLAPDSGLPGVLLGTVVGYALPLAWVWWLLNRSWPAVAAQSRTLHDLKTVFKRDWKFTFTQTGGFLNSTIELWLGAAMLTGPGASSFAAAQRIGRVLVIPATSLSIVFSPAISRLVKAGNSRQLELLVRTASSISTAVSGLLWLPIVLAPSVLLGFIFGDTDAPGATALVLISTGYLLNSVSGMSGTTLSMANYEGVSASITWCVVAARVVSGVLCAWFGGVTGLAASSAGMSALYYVASWTAVRRLLGISTHATLRPRLSMLGRISG